VAGGYEIVAGHRRYLAACAAGLDSMACIVREESDVSADAAKLTENLYRQELSAVEEGGFFAELYEAAGNDVDAVAARVGKSRGYVESRLLLLSGDGEVLQALARHEITLGVAAELNKIEDAAKRHYYLGWAVTQGAKIQLVRFWRESANACTHAEETGAVPRELPEELRRAADDLYRCFICGEKEPVYDLAVMHIHRACRVMVERQAMRAGGHAAGVAETP